MKKIALTLAAALIAVTSILCFAGCGDSPEQKLANYVASDECQKELDSMKSTYESMMDVDVRAEGKSLVYDLTYKTELPEESLDTVKSSLESLSSTYEGIANSIKESVGIDDPSVVVKINTKDGTNIFSKTYNATK
ncbi:MAG: DUF4854 domain-containing protein [Ruminococcus bromii]